ncbi:putative epoxide hydrolase [Stachybotrys elegans]|uniref:Epoxide hydrolase n=1 Tax=Stachybotrys elegans TaxID=80388 RepID=A0A8K0T1Z4_9HYPO|nr:putative epoxide hydrolase [Stachybotrys elegans]
MSELAAFETFALTTQQDPPITIHGFKSRNDASLPGLLLLHGFPQTRHMWHRVAPHLTDKYTVVMPDLRGYGDSSKPQELGAYAKSAMARDCVSVMDQVGFAGESFFVCAHDRGARVAHKLCVDHGRRVRKAVLLDICPTLRMYEATSMGFATAYFHWFFLIQPAPVPETFISADPRTALRLFLGGARGDLSAFDAQAVDSYARALEDPDTVRAMCQDYRAAASLDLEEQRADKEQGRLIRCPLRILWGKKGVCEAFFEPLEDWRAVTAEGVPVDGWAVDSGHWIPECVPEEVVANVLEFCV